MNKRIAIISSVLVAVLALLCLAWTPSNTSFNTNDFAIGSPGVGTIRVSDNIAEYTNTLVFNGGRFLNTMPFVETNIWQGTTLTSNENFGIVCIGDSLMVNKVAPLSDSMARIFGKGGFGFNHAVSLAGGATQLSGRFTNWMSGTLHSIPVGGTATYTTDGSTGFICDNIDFFYYTTNGASTITVETNFNGGSFATAMTINANTGARGIAHTNIYIPRGIYTVRVGCSSGTGLVPASPLITRDRAIGKGACILQLASPGLGWNDFTNIDTVIITNLGAILPKGPIIVEESSDAVQWLSSTNVIERLTRHRPRDVVVVSPNPFVNAAQEATNVQQIAVMRNYSITNGWTYFDQHSMFGTAAAMTNAGILDPSGADIHPYLSGRSYAVDAMLSLTGLGPMLSGIRDGKASPIIIYNVSSDYDPQYGVYQNTIAKPLYFVLRGTAADSMQIIFQDRNAGILSGFYLDSSFYLLFGTGGGHLLRFTRATGHAAFDNAVTVGGTFTNSGQTRLDSGIQNNGGGFKHGRVTTGSISATSSALVTNTWTTAFANTSYTVSASVLDSTAALLSLEVTHIESITTSNVVVRVSNTSAGSLTGTLHVIAVHD